MNANTNNSAIGVLSENRAQLMGLAMLFIMLFHQPFVNGGFLQIFHCCGHWGVDVFMFLSGLGCYFSFKKTSIMGFYKRRVLRIFPSALCAGVVKLAILAFLFHDPFNLESWLTLFGLNLWFIRSILILYLIYPLLLWGIKRVGAICFWWMLTVLITIFLIGFEVAPFGNYLCRTIVAWTAARLPIFVIGMLLGVVGGGNAFRISGLYIVVSCFALAFLTYIFVVCKICFPQYYRVPKLYIYPLLAFPIPLLSYYAGTFIKGRSVFLRWIGKHSLELYLVHEFVFSFCRRCLEYAEYHQLPNLPPYVSLLVAMSASFVAAWALKRITTRVLSFCSGS